MQEVPFEDAVFLWEDWDICCCVCVFDVEEWVIEHADSSTHVFEPSIVSLYAAIGFEGREASKPKCCRCRTKDHAKVECQRIDNYWGLTIIGRSSRSFEGSRALSSGCGFFNRQHLERAPL